MKKKCRVSIVRINSKVEGSILLNKSTRKLCMFTESIGDGYEPLALFITSKDETVSSPFYLNENYDYFYSPSEKKRSPRYRLVAMSVANYSGIPLVPRKFLLKFIEEWNKGSMTYLVNVEFEDFINSNPIWSPALKLNNGLVKCHADNNGEAVITEIEELQGNDRVSNWSLIFKQLNLFRLIDVKSDS